MTFDGEENKIVCGICYDDGDEIELHEGDVVARKSKMVPATPIIESRDGLSILEITHKKYRCPKCFHSTDWMRVER